jgi:inhibitor of KinA
MMEVRRLTDRFLLLMNLPVPAWKVADWLNSHGARWGIDEACSAYDAVGVYGRVEETVDLEEWLQGFEENTGVPSRLHKIPVCYELGTDLDFVAKSLNLTISDVISMHSRTTFEVYAIGFQPGFPYLGYLPPNLMGLDRLDKPRSEVPSGSVGITGDQCGIYPSSMPGGWRIIGRTPLMIADVANEWFPIKAGDRVVFHAIDQETFANLEGKRLSDA